MNDEAQDRQIRNRLLGIIVVVLVLAALKAAAPVAMPLTFALFLVVLAWPLQARLRRRLPASAAYGLTLLALLGIATAFTWTLAESADEVVDWVQDARPRLEVLAAQLRETLAAAGLSVGGGGGDGNRLAEAAVGVARGVASGLAGFLGGVLLVTALCVLALREVDEFRLKFTGPLRNAWNAYLIDSAGSVVGQLQSYVLTRTMTSGVTGLLTGLFAWAIGMDLALVWGVLTFLLNYIPTLGTLGAVAGITLFAYMQFESVGMMLLVLGVTGVLQVVIGSYVDPRLQGRNLSLSPFAVLVSVVFWGWMWGIPGALLGVPLTAAMMIAFREFGSTRWLAELLDDERPHEAAQADEPEKRRPPSKRV